MRAWRVGVVLAAAAAVVPAGCDSNSATATRAARKPTKPVELKVADFAGIDRAIRDRKGSVVLVDFWAPWCGPCKQSFPHLVGLHREYEELGLACMSVSIDRGPTESSRGFLIAQGADFANFHWVNSDAEHDKLVSRFGYGGYIPYQVIFDRNGDRVWDTQNPGGRSLDQAVQQELTAKAR